MVQLLFVDGGASNEEWFQGLAGLTALTSLNLTLDKGVVPAVEWQALGGLTTALIKLNLGGCDELSDDGLRSLASRLTALTDLNLEDCELVSDHGLQA